MKAFVSTIDIRPHVWGVETAAFSNEGIVVEESNHCRDGFQPQVVVGDEGPPEFYGFVPWSAATPWAFEHCEEFFIGDFPKDRLKLTNNWGELSIRTEYSIINRHHREDIPSCLVGAVGVDAPSAPLFFKTSVLDESTRHNEQVSIMTKEHCQLATSLYDIGAYDWLT